MKCVLQKFSNAMTITDLRNTEAETGWKPTPYLRYVEKIVTLPTTTPNVVYDHKVKMLQQLWINSDGRDEWRDVVFAAKS